MHYFVPCAHGGMQSPGFKGGSIDCTEQITVPHVQTPHNHSYFLVHNKHQTRLAYSRCGLNYSCNNVALFALLIDVVAK